MPDHAGLRVLLDENIDRLIQPLFDDTFQVVRVDEHGWKGLKNGHLLHAAAQEFDVFVTMDKHLQFQQNIAAHELAIVVIRSVSNAYVDVAPLMSSVNSAIRDAKPGVATVVAR